MKKNKSTIFVPPAPDPEFDAIVSEASRLTLSLSPLIATPEQWRIPEESLVNGTRNRRDFILTCMSRVKFYLISKEKMLSIINCEGEYGPERMCSAWWSCLHIFSVCTTDMDILNTSAIDLIKANVIGSEATATFDNKEDPRINYRRIDARKELEILMASISKDAVRV